MIGPSTETFGDVPGDRTRRVKFAYPVLAKAVGSVGPPYRLHASNLSLGGMYIRNMSPFLPGTRIRISLEVRGKPLPFAEGEVAWVRDLDAERSPDPGFGVRFLSLPGKSLALVKHLMGIGAENTDQPPPREAPVSLPTVSEVDGDDPADGSAGDRSWSGTLVMFPPPGFGQVVANTVPPPAPPLRPPLALSLPPELEPPPVELTRRKERAGANTVNPPEPAPPLAELPPPPALEATEPAARGRAWRWLRLAVALGALAAWASVFTHSRPDGPPRAQARSAPAARR